jgi:hypothetical protein
MTILGTALQRMAAARKLRRDMRDMADMPDYLLADIGYNRDWRGNLHKVPYGNQR